MIVAHRPCQMVIGFVISIWLYLFQDQAQLRHVMNCLQSATGVTPTPDQPQTSTIDAEAFQHLLLMVRSIAVTRPHNLVRFAEQETCVIIHPCEGATGIYCFVILM